MVRKPLKGCHNEASQLQYLVVLKSTHKHSENAELESVWNLQSTYKRRYYHVVGGLPPDAIHDILEGVLLYHTKELLKFYILEEKNSLEELNKRITSFDYWPEPHAGRRSKTKQKRVNRLEVESVTDNADESEEDTVSKFHCQYLWEFLQSLLSCKKFNNRYIEWKNHPEGIFKLNDHHSLARLWGIQKKRKNMTYDKLNRALRYYYSKNILQKVDGERLTYKFCKSVYEYKC